MQIKKIVVLKRRFFSSVLMVFLVVMPNYVVAGWWGDPGCWAADNCGIDPVSGNPIPGHPNPSPREKVRWNEGPKKDTNKGSFDGDIELNLCSWDLKVVEVTVCTEDEDESTDEDKDHDFRFCAEVTIGPLEFSGGFCDEE